MRGKRKQFLQNQHNTGITPAGAGKTCFSVAGAEPQRDHPRRCGENRAQTCPTYIPTGSPPQVRGKPHLEGGVTMRLRITPAGAGKTPPSAFHVSASRDHPRRCGENRYSCSRRRCRRGSPPQVRGKQPVLGINIHAVRITPAGAGKTPILRINIVHCQDHPRRCGENDCTVRLHGKMAGSPPQVRGKLFGLLH